MIEVIGMAKTFNVPNGTKLAFFPDEISQLNLEVAHHPALQSALAHIPHTEDNFEVLLAGVCAYCEIILDDVYQPEDILNLCKICTQKLQDKRGKIVIQNGKVI